MSSYRSVTERFCCPSLSVLGSLGLFSTPPRSVDFHETVSCDVSFAFVNSELVTATVVPWTIVKWLKPYAVSNSVPIPPSKSKKEK